MTVSLWLGHVDLANLPNATLARTILLILGGAKQTSLFFIDCNIFLYHLSFPQCKTLFFNFSGLSQL